MSTSLTYNAPVNFLIDQTLGYNLDPQTQAAFQSVIRTLNQIILTFVNNCGIGSQNTDTWPNIAGTSSTVLASNMQRFYVTASEDILQSALVSLWNSGGQLLVKNANATDNTAICDGFCSTPDGIAAGAVGEIILHNGVITGAGLTPATRYWLGTAPGEVTTVPPGVVGNVEQYVGIALGSGDLYFVCSSWIQH